MASIATLSLGEVRIRHNALRFPSCGNVGLCQSRCLVIKSVVAPSASKFNSHHHKLRGVVVAAANLDDASEDAVMSPLSSSLDRRELLAGTVAGGVSLIGAAAPAHAAPVGDPVMKTCNPAQVEHQQKKKFVACCPPKPKRTIDFKPDTGPIRVRRAAHLQDEDYIAKYNEAYKKMRALPSDDPRSMFAQANVHCAYCNFGYRQEGSKAKLQIHGSWLFLPWHRWYLYFHEKILGSLIGDPEFALPFWNWDNQNGGNTMPMMFLREGSELYDEKRNKNNYPPRIINLTNAFDSAEQTPEYVQQIKEGNLNQMRLEMVGFNDVQTFYGGIYRKGDTVPTQGDGSIERGSHNAGHIFVGDLEKDFGEDMGNFYSAGNDPLFYSHHSNIDRLWEVWRNRLGKGDLTDPDYNDTEFLFFDENADLVRCKVKDCIDAEKQLKSRYEVMPSDEEWINYKPKPSGTSGSVVSSLVPGMAAMAAEYPELRSITQVKAEPLTVTVARPNGGPKDNKVDEILVLEGLEISMGSTAAFSVFINLPGANDKTPVNCAEYVGSFQNVPHFMPGMADATRTTNARFSIASNLQVLGLSDSSKITVTLVPKGKDKDLAFTLSGASIN